MIFTGVIYTARLPTSRQVADRSGYGGVEGRLTNLPLLPQSSQRAIWGQQQKPKLRSISQTSPRRKLNSAPSVALSSSHCRIRSASELFAISLRSPFKTRRNLATWCHQEFLDKAINNSRSVCG